MSIDLSEEGGQQDAMKALQAENAELLAQGRLFERWLVHMTIAFLVAGGIAAGACAAASTLRDDLEATQSDARQLSSIAAEALARAADGLELAQGYRRALDMERARYRACYWDRMSCEIGGAR